MPVANLLRVSRLIAAQPQVAYEVVVHVERFPSFMSNVSSVAVLSASSARKVVSWQMMIDDAPLDWTEEILYDAVKLRATFKSLTGVFEKFDGFWQVTPSGSGSLIEVNVEYELGIPEIEAIIAPVLRVRLASNLESMLGHIERQAS